MATRSQFFRYRHFTILKDQILGHGSYGAVYKARCDQLTCAAKILHPTIVDPYDPGSEKILQRFQQECDFLNRICHPNIVQYLGVCQDHESNLPVLLMELLDSSLTKMLERSPHPIPYHIQVDICSDVSLAVAYLHSNGIIHRDLSGNNVLVIAGRRAKVTDFGMSKIARSEQHLTSLTFCPGNATYMSPESLKEPPRYTEKLDVFSQGVIMIQVCTQQFPDPGPPVKEIEDTRSPTGMMQIPVLEPERRKKHIDLIDPTHPLLPIALTCLEYRERGRPSAKELCQRLIYLKECQEYSKSCKENASKEEQIATYQQEIATSKEQIAAYQHDIAAKNQEIATMNERISAKTKQVITKDQENQMLKTQLHELNQKLMESEYVTAQFQETNQQLQRQISDLQKLMVTDETNAQVQHSPTMPEPPKSPMRSNETEIDLKWRHGGKAPFKHARQGLVVDKNVIYLSADWNLFSFNSTTGKWNTKLQLCPYICGSLAIVQGLLTMVGGWLPSDDKATNKLVSLTEKEEGSRWIEPFPPMPTCRRYTTATTYQNHLIVAGGSSTFFCKGSLDIVEILNTETYAWSTAASLPHPFSCGSATVCGDRLYLLGGENKNRSCRSVFSCLLPELLQACDRPTRLSLVDLLLKSRQPEVWQRITDTPMYYSTCATVCGQLVAVGGRDDSNEKASTVYKYDPNIQSWNIISHMTNARSSCYVAVVDISELIVVSGAREQTHNDIEIASF